MSREWKQEYAANEVEHVDCPMCGMNSTKEIAREWSLGIVQCSGCGLIYINPRVLDSQQHYRHDDRSHWENKYGGIYNGTEPHPRDANYEEHIRIIKSFKPAGKLLDVGTHSGWFLRKCRNMGWELHGVEPSPILSSIAKEKFGLDVVNSYLTPDLFPPQSFDVITMIDVLEHIPTPNDVMQIIRSLLKPDGLLFIKTPNADWNILKYRFLSGMLRKQVFDIFDPREHIVQYTETSLAKMLGRNGLAVKKFYVPKPIPSGTALRNSLREAATGISRFHFSLTKRVDSLCTDLACIGEIKK